MEQTFQLEQLSCPSCRVKIEKGLRKIEGVDSADVLFNASKVKVNFDEGKTSKDTLKNAIEKLGFEVK
ncbi:Heavy-metal-associated domain-containing protein [Pelagirhabdus alkalitolerans]|uniref:Heavy-metal-associated domain-containing protein n=1 Tax=Pelagirhabdus alkalitolerans TaxID=1612202 RepID=A0A1G6GLT1_9BACI|nr:heavy-metal-associated domain-containing protein [Pelagirhabdus alkalitolerans]SDB82992.1 Heavy-metal-associated domain-containing protein [Pelagirhabdus alkalitolerans]